MKEFLKRLCVRFRISRSSSRGVFNHGLRLSPPHPPDLSLPPPAISPPPPDLSLPPGPAPPIPVTSISVWREQT